MDPGDPKRIHFLKEESANMIWNYLISIAAIAVIVVEIYFVLKRNRTITLKGKDDFFTFTLAVFFVITIFPVSDMDSLLENVRNILVLVAVFGTAAIKRGFSDRGLEKICFTVPWEDITSIQINEYQSNKLQVVCQTKKGAKFKLYFGKYILKDVLRTTQKHISEVYMQDSLDQVLKYKDLSNQKNPGKKKKKK